MMKHQRGAKDQRSTTHSSAQERRYIIALALVMVLLASIYPLLARSTYQGSADLHATIEIVGAFFGLMAGIALVVRFYAQSTGNRFHLLIGLALFANGAEDFVHGLMSFRNLFGIPASSLARFIPGTYVTGRMMLAAMLILAPFASQWLGKSANPKREAKWVSLLVSAATAGFTALAFYIPLPRFIHPERLISRPVDFASAFMFLLALAAFLREYHRRPDMLTWWVALSAGVSAIAQVMMSFSKALYDPFFDIAHVYKVLGYMIPLLGFSLYQIRLITEHEQAWEEIQRHSALLEQSNRDLQEFAYVASHDLQEPLRKIIAFGDRLATRYEGVLDERGRDYLNRMMSAAQRMQALINALLTFSRVQTRAQPFTPVDLNEVAKEVVADLELQIGRTGGRVEVGDLPTIEADLIQMRQLLQNFIGNALKFHREGGGAFRPGLGGCP